MLKRKRDFLHCSCQPEKNIGRYIIYVELVYILCILVSEYKYFAVKCVMKETSWPTLVFCIIKVSLTQLKQQDYVISAITCSNLIDSLFKPL